MYYNKMNIYTLNILNSYKSIPKIESKLNGQKLKFLYKINSKNQQNSLNSFQLTNLTF